jgi:hypothetical protein
MMNLDASWTGTATTAGAITFWTTGLPGDLASRLPGSDRIFTLTMPNKTFHVDIVSGPAEVTLQANEGDPDEAGDWYSIASVTAAGVTVDNNVRKFVRALVVTPGGGITVRLSATS